MSSQRELVIAKVAELLTQAAGASAAVHRHPMRPIDKDKLPALCIYATNCKPAQDGQTWGLRDYQLTLRIEARAIGQVIDQVLDPFVSLIARVMLREPFLDGLSFRVEEGELQYDALDGEKCFAASAQDFIVHFADDPTGQGQAPLDPDGPPVKKIDKKEIR